jgi:hypothetical protein
VPKYRKEYYFYSNVDFEEGYRVNSYGSGLARKEVGNGKSQADYSSKY